MGSQRWRDKHGRIFMGNELDVALVQVVNEVCERWSIHRRDLVQEALRQYLDPRVEAAPALLRVNYVAWEVHKLVEGISHLRGLRTQLDRASIEMRLLSKEASSGRLVNRRLSESLFYLEAEVKSLDEKITEVCEALIKEKAHFDKEGVWKANADVRERRPEAKPQEDMLAKMKRDAEEGRREREHA